MPHMILMGPPSERVPTSSHTIPEPERLDLTTDLALHAAPAISLIIDFYALEPKYSKFASRYFSVIVAAVLGTWYSCWVEYCASFNGMCAYPSFSISMGSTLTAGTASPIPLPHL